MSQQKPLLFGSWDFSPKQSMEADWNFWYSPWQPGWTFITIKYFMIYFSSHFSLCCLFSLPFASICLVPRSTFLVPCSYFLLPPFACLLPSFFSPSSLLLPTSSCVLTPAPWFEINFRYISKNIIQFRYTTISIFRSNLVLHCRRTIIDQNSNINF